MQDWTMTFQSKEVPAWTLQVALVVKNLPANVGYSIDAGSIPGLGRSPGGGKRQPTPVFLPGEFHGQRSLVGYSPWGCRVGHNGATNTHAHTLVLWRSNKYVRPFVGKNSWLKIMLSQKKERSSLIKFI